MASSRRAINPRFFENQPPDGIILDAKVAVRRPATAQSATINNSQQSLTHLLKAARKSGGVNLSNRQLKDIPIVIFAIADNLDADEKFWEVAPLAKIDLSYNEISDLPDQFENYLMSTLQSFKIRDNKLVDLPASLFRCHELWHLDLGMNKLTDISACNFEELCELKELFLFENLLSSLPDSLSRCLSLQTLDLHQNVLTELPSPFRLSHLVKLNLKRNNLTNLPSDLSDMMLLEFLDVSENVLECLPDLSKLRKLSFLDATQNRVKLLPMLPLNGALDRMHIGHNKLADLRVENLMRLQPTLSELLVHDNCILSIPAELSLFVKLRVVDFTNNSVSDIPAALGYNKALQRFQIEGNPIRTIRRTLLTQSTEELKKYLRTRGPALEADTECRGISGISGSTATSARLTAPSTMRSDIDGDGGKGSGIIRATVKNEYTEEGEVIVEDATRLLLYRVRDMSTAGSLDLSKLNMNIAPMPTISDYLQKRALHLGSVVTLNLSNNQLTLVSLLDSQLYLLTGLQVLDLRNNLLGDSSAASSILSTSKTSSVLVYPSIGCASSSSATCILPESLQRLDLSRNKLTTTDVTLLLNGTTNITELNIANNSLKKLPSEISSLLKLRELSVASNQITTVDNIQFSCLSRLEVIDLSSNSLTDAQSLVRFPLPALRSVNLQYNNITVVPAQFGTQFPSLTYLGLYGNPQKTVRSNLLSNMEALLLYLRNKLQGPEGSTSVDEPMMPVTKYASAIQSRHMDPTTTTLSEQENVKTLPNTDMAAATKVHSLTHGTRAVSIGASVTSKTSVLSSNDRQVSSPSILLPTPISTPVSIPASSTASASASASHSLLHNSKSERSRLEALIRQLEREQDHFSTSKMRLAEVKKELAVNRAALSRILTSV